MPSICVLRVPFSCVRTRLGRADVRRTEKTMAATRPNSVKYSIREPARLSATWHYQLCDRAIPSPHDEGVGRRQGRGACELPLPNRLPPPLPGPLLHSAEEREFGRGAKSRPARFKGMSWSAEGPPSAGAAKLVDARTASSTRVPALLLRLGTAAVHFCF